MRFFLVALLASVMFAAQAQEGDPAECDAAGALAIVAEFAADPQLEPLAALHIILEAVREALIDCEGLSFNSDDDGRQPALGPITLDEGTYRLTLVTDGYFQTYFTALDGKCQGTGGMASMGLIFNLMEGQGDNAQVIIQSEGCEALIEVSLATEDWTIDIEKLR